MDIDKNDSFGKFWSVAAANRLIIRSEMKKKKEKDEEEEKNGRLFSDDSNK